MQTEDINQQTKERKQKVNNKRKCYIPEQPVTSRLQPSFRRGI